MKLLTQSEAQAVVDLLRRTVATYGKPGGPWNVPREPGAWISEATAMLARVDGSAEQGPDDEIWGVDAGNCPLCGALPCDWVNNPHEPARDAA